MSVAVLRAVVAAAVLWSSQAVAADRPEAPRAARSVHLGYVAPEAAAFYNELTVEKSVPGSYFMACGFSHGYFGIQELGQGRKVVLFSVWDPSKGDNPNAVPDEQRVEVLDKADDVTARRFGGEGTGAQSFFPHDWKTGQTYRFLVRADAAGKKTAFAAYFFLPETGTWKHLVTFRTTTGGDRLKGLYSFIEDFRRDGKSATEVRRAIFGNGWTCDAAGQWTPLTKARFTASGAKWEAKETIDAGTIRDAFFLQTGGDTKTTTPLRTLLQRPAGSAAPPKVPAQTPPAPQAAKDPAAPRADHSKVPGVVIDHSAAASGKYVGSPSIAVLPSGDYVASHDEFGPKSTEHKRAVTRVFRSTDKGRSWQPQSVIDGQFWSSLFVHRGELYILGTLSHYGDFVIRKSADGGRTWTEPVDAATGLLSRGRYHCAPMPVVLHEGRLWRGMEETTDPKRWGAAFRAMMTSAPADADLLRAGNWTFTDRLGGDPKWLGGQFGGWLEGNAVVTPKGRIVDILRVDFPAGAKAAVVEVSKDGKAASFDPASGFIDFPGGAKKFTIRFDAESKRYWSLANYVPPKHQGARAAGVRNTLALTSSDDLRRWRVDCILLYHPEVRRHAFQYPDWQFDGEDIIAAVRTAYDDGLGGAHNAHDANYLTFHRFRNFRHLTLADSVVKPGELGIKD